MQFVHLRFNECNNCEKLQMDSNLLSEMKELYIVEYLSWIIQEIWQDLIMNDTIIGELVSLFCLKNVIDCLKKFAILIFTETQYNSTWKINWLAIIVMNHNLMYGMVALPISKD